MNYIFRNMNYIFRNMWISLPILPILPLSLFFIKVDESEPRYNLEYPVQ
jgi:hypothetical protein